MNPTIIERKERWARKMSGREKPTARGHDRLPPGQHLAKGFPVLDLGVQPKLAPADWRLEIGGLVENPVALGWNEFHALPQFEDTSDFHCVTTWSVYDLRWGGVSFFTLADLVRPRPEATHLLFRSADEYTTNVPLAAALDDDALVATRLDGGPIPREHGGPARAVIPKLYAWKSAKWITGIEFLGRDQPGFWEVRGYSNTADPWTEDRFG